MSRVVFLLGAGASMDAGLPSVAELTGELRERLSQTRDWNGETHPEFLELFDAIAALDPYAAKNYERFFEWLSLLIKVQKEPFRCAFSITHIAPELSNFAGPLAYSIKNPVLGILRSRCQSSAYNPTYLARLGEYLPLSGRLKVFSLNYDLCVEESCKASGIDVITGFNADTGKWAPSRFNSSAAGINLYKLHGSLNWGNPEDDSERLVEWYPLDWEREADFLLGPGPKLQSDEPFVTLYSEFHKALRRAKICVVIGYSYGDGHINGPIRVASKSGTRIISVNPSQVGGDFVHRSISSTAKEALEGGELARMVNGILNN